MANMNNQIDGYGEEGPDMVFHYKKGSFREREDQATRDLATGVSVPKRGLFRALVSTKGNRIMLMVLVMSIGVVLIVSFFSKGQERDCVSGVNMELSAFSFNGQVYASLALSGVKKDEALQRNLSVNFTAVDSDSVVSNSQSFYVCFDSQSAELENGIMYVRAIFTDYDIIKIQCSVQDSENQGEDTVISAKVQKH